MVPGVEAPPSNASAVFGQRFDLAVQYVELLATAGVERGLIGPREGDRLWSRHVLNCAVVAEVLPETARVVDVGSGAGLPGLPLALARPDLRVDLVEPLERRAMFLTEAVDLLGLGSQVRVVRGRAEDRLARELVGDSEWVTARAVAPLDRLVGWCLPLLKSGGKLVAMKGTRAASEIEEHRAQVSRMGAARMDLVECGVGVVNPVVAVVVVERGAGTKRSRGKS